jgi:hypothetical protein
MSFGSGIPLMSMDVPAANMSVSVQSALQTTGTQQIVRNGRPGNCGAPSNIGNGEIGIEAHIQIQTYFRAQFGADAFVEVNVPGAAVSGMSGRADAVLRNEGNRLNDPLNFSGIYEFKPIQHRNISGKLQEARDQRDRYVQNFANTGRGSGRAGVYWSPPETGQMVGVWLLDPREELVIGSYYHAVPNSNGLIFYWCRWT